MRLLLIAPQPFFEPRGTPINVRLMTKALVELGHDVDLAVFPHGQEVDIPGVTIIHAPKIPGVGKAPIGPSWQKLVYDIALAEKILLRLLTRRYDVIHGVEEGAFMAWLFARLIRAKFVFDMDSHLTDQLRYSRFLSNRVLLWLAEKMESAALRSADSVITVCPYLTDVAKRYADPLRVFQVEDIPQEFPPPPAGHTQESLRAELGIPHGALVALYTGNLEKYQGIDLLMESIPEVIAGSPPATVFVIVGGPAAAVTHYQARAEALGIAPHVRLAGPRPLSHMPLYYEMADILLSPRMEGTNTPLKIYTYLATGKPIVATALATHTQLLASDLAQLATPEKVDYARAILLLLNDAERRRALGEAGRRFVESRYNYDTFRRKIGQAYEPLGRE
ncbi:MAG: glycosyltransferase family 4 protein [Nitrospinae bacterium]|nr:glycosyltransferase family 4 protein [Nitrospinota bacterium]